MSCECQCVGQSPKVNDDCTIEMIATADREPCFVQVSCVENADLILDPCDFIVGVILVGVCE